MAILVAFVASARAVIAQSDCFLADPAIAVGARPLSLVDVQPVERVGDRVGAVERTGKRRRPNPETACKGLMLRGHSDRAALATG